VVARDSQPLRQIAASAAGPLLTTEVMVAESPKGLFVSDARLALSPRFVLH
jgi:hypothetical protein